MAVPSFSTTQTLTTVMRGPANEAAEWGPINGPIGIFDIYTKVGSGEEVEIFPTKRVVGRYLPPRNWRRKKCKKKDRSKMFLNSSTYL